MYIIILDDGTTYGSLKGSKVAYIPDGETDINVGIDDWIRNNPKKLVPVNVLENVQSVEFNGDIVVAPDMENE